MKEQRFEKVVEVDNENDYSYIPIIMFISLWIGFGISFLGDKGLIITEMTAFSLIFIIIAYTLHKNVRKVYWRKIK